MANGHTQLIWGGIEFKFQTAGLETFGRQSTYRWPVQERIGRPIALQHVGEGEDTITVTGYIHPHLKGTATEMNKLRKLAEEGKPKIMTTGTGLVLGKYVCVDVKDDFSNMLDDLRPRRVDFTATFKKYFEDGLKK